MAKKKVQFEITAVDKTAAVFKKVGGKVGTLGKGLSAVGSKSIKVMGNIAKMGAALTAALGVAAVAGATKAVNVASQLEEVTGKFNTVFKNMRGDAKIWSDELVGSYAMSTREAREYLSAVQDLLVPMGMAEYEAGEMSSSIVKLAADLGSFNNKSTSQVMDDITSALTGSYETMKKYGVVLSAASIEQKAFSMGLATTKEELTPAIKAQAAYQMMVEGSSAAMGDMERTQASYANQMKQLSANWEEFVGIIGQEFLPYATQAVTAINTWFKANQELIKAKVGEWIEKIVKWSKQAWQNIGEIASKVEIWYRQNQQVIDSGFVDFLYAMKAAAESVATVFGFVGKAIGWVSAKVVELIDKISQLDAVKATIDFFGKASPVRPLTETIENVRGKFSDMASQINSAKIGTTVGFGSDMSSAIFSRLMELNQQSAFATAAAQTQTYGAANIARGGAASAKKQMEIEKEGMLEIMKMFGGAMGGGAGTTGGGVVVNIENAFGAIGDQVADQIAAALQNRGYDIGHMRTA
jgi:hypothetical protein